MQARPGIIAPGGEKGRHGGDVLHEGRDIVKGGAAQALEDVALFVRHDKIGLVDVPLAVALAGEGAPLQPELP